MKNRLVAIVITSTLLTASSRALSNTYIGAKAGKSWLNQTCLSISKCKAEDKAFGMIMGYDVWETLSIEAGYDELGKFSTSDLPLQRMVAYTVGPKLNIAISDLFFLYTKLGVGIVHYGKEDVYSYLGAAGLEVLSKDNISVRIEYQYLSNIEHDAFVPSANSLTLGLVYNFGGKYEASRLFSAQHDPSETVDKGSDPITPARPTITRETFQTRSLNASNFKSDSAILTEEIKHSLVEISNILNSYKQAKVRLVGHTDSTGSHKYNQFISEQRANAVANELIALGADVGQVIIIGLGENDPVATNTTKLGRAKNRRVEVEIIEFDYQVQH
ncbi:OmpA family protein [Vibrio sp. YMD68]|uniref:OmpA family protein n=1 Tax=Vibrio sp. YMD68 TaxID=3042300 RepID=UPI00249A0592|nr:OmpA family protein [Vibrio sp. YMD68]WGV98022.1 OmpA family protein [Vibrio sp. YMD68]